MSKQGFITTDAQVKEALGGDRFRVELDNGVVIMATLCGKIRQHHIRILPGDRVRLELSPYDMTRGRIAYRYNR